MKRNGLIKRIALLSGAALLSVGSPGGACGAESGGRSADYQTIENISQGSNMSNGRPQKADDLVTVGETRAVSAAVSASGAERKTAVSVSSTQRETAAGDATSGPGAASASLGIEIRDEDADTGPQVEEVQLKETYHEEYDIYTESIADQFFIYTNIGNNGITDQQVYLDIPENVSFTAEQDGASIGYTSNQQLGGTGTYVFRFTAVKDSSKPLAEQVIYETTFHFRIQPKSTRVTESQSTGETERYSFGQNASSLTASAAETGAAEETLGMFPPVTDDTAAEAPADASAPDEDRETASDASGSVPAAGAADFALEAEEAGLPEENSEGGASYDETTGMYRIELSDGTSFLASVPNGMLSNTGVYLDLSGLGQAGQQAELYLDGTPYVSEEWSFSQTGTYTVRIPDGEELYIFSFRLLGAALSDLDSYTIPVEMKLLSFTRDGESRMASVQGNGQRLDFTEDGAYRLTLENAQGVSYEVELVSDHEPPKFSAVYDGQAIALSYESQDIARIDVIDGQETRSYESLSQITGAGSYVIRVYDEAGNVSEVSVKIPKKVNIAGVIAVAMIIALIGGTIFFIRRTKKDFNVK